MNCCCGRSIRAWFSARARDQILDLCRRDGLRRCRGRTSVVGAARRSGVADCEAQLLLVVVVEGDLDLTIFLGSFTMSHRIVPGREKKTMRCMTL